MSHQEAVYVANKFQESMRITTSDFGNTTRVNETKMAVQSMVAQYSLGMQQNLIYNVLKHPARDLTSMALILNYDQVPIPMQLSMFDR